MVTPSTPLAPGPPCGWCFRPVAGRRRLPLAPRTTVVGNFQHHVIGITVGADPSRKSRGRGGCGSSVSFEADDPRPGAAAVPALYRSRMSPTVTHQSRWTLALADDHPVV